MKFLSPTIFSVFIVLFFPFSTSHAQASAQGGDLIKCVDYSAVYYLADDGKRYVFPNENIFYSWYENFDGLVEISCDELSDYPLGDRLPYQAGTRLVKVPSIATVYAVEPQGVLRPITSESQAMALYGDAWTQRVDDLSEAFFPSYEVQADLADGEIPSGTVLVDDAGLYYRVNGDGEAEALEGVFDQGAGLRLKHFAISLEEIEEQLNSTIEQIEIDEIEDLFAELRPVAPTQEPLVTQEFLMAFHACDNEEADCSQPSNHEVYLAQSADGKDWELVPDWEPFDGSVPDVIRRGDTLYIYTASQELVRYDIQTNTQEDPTHVTVEGLAEGFVDPSMYVDEDGLLVLFFLYGQENGDPAQCQSGENSCTKYIGSATEVEGSDGEEFILDDGYRAEIEITEDGDFMTVSDPDIFTDGDTYVMYVSYGSDVLAWTSDTLHGSYEPSDEWLSDGSGGIPSGYYDEDEDAYWTYVHIQSGDETVIKRAVHSSLSQTLTGSQWETVMTGTSIGLGSSYSVASPGFAVNAEE